MYFDPHEDEWRRMSDDEEYYESYHYDYDYYSSEDEFDPLPETGGAFPDSPLDLNTCLWRGSPIVPPLSRKHIASLQELCSRVVGQTHPFELVLQHQPRVPEGLQKRIAFWSFPLNMEQVLDYGKMMGADIEAVHAKECQVSEMLQTGMHLTAKVTGTSTGTYDGSSKPSFQVFVQVDRGCITATECSCGSTTWCTHILALITTRLQEGSDSVLKVYPPLSETLSKFSRDELQKLLQYFVEHLPLEGVPAVQEIACALQDTDSNESNCTTVPDATAGCSTGAEAMWYIDQEALVHSLELVYDKMISVQYVQNSPFTLCNDGVLLTPTIVDFQQFTEGEEPSVFAFLLQHHSRHIVYVLKWALDKMIQSFNRPPAHSVYKDVPDGELKWMAWCFCHMVAPALRIFFTDTLLSIAAKKDVCTSLESACLEAAPVSKPVSALLRSVLSVAHTLPVPNPLEFCSTLTKLQHCKEGPPIEFAEHLNSLMAMLLYFKFHQKLTTPDMAELVTNACKALFPSLSSISSVCDLATPAMTSLPRELLMEYGILLMECLVQARAEKETILEMALSLKFLEWQSMRRSKDLLRYYTWADKKILQLVKEDREAVSLERREGHSLLLDRFKDLLTMKVHSSAAVEMWSWKVMELVCHAEGGQQEVLQAVNEIAQDFIGQLGCTPIPDGGDEEELQEAILSVLVSLFTSLPPSAAQDLFEVLHKAYPQPLDCIQSNELQKLCPNGRDYEYYQADVPALKSALPQSSHADAQPVDESHSTSTTYAVDSIQRRASHVLSLVSTSHVNFLLKLYKCTDDEGAEPLLKLQLAMLYFQARNCRLSKWFVRFNAIKYKSLYSHSTDCITNALLHKATSSAALRHLVNSWRYCLTPRQICNALAKAAAKDMPVCSDVCTLVQSVVDSFPGAIAAKKLALDVLFYGPPEKFLDLMVSAIQIDQNLLNEKVPTPTAVNFFCQLLELVGRMHTKIKTSPTQVTNADKCLQRLQDFSREIVTVMTSQTGIHSQMKTSAYGLARSTPRYSLNVEEIASVVCDAGQDVFLGLVPFLPLLSSFPGDLKMLYARVHGVNISSVSSDLLLVPPFQSAILQAFEDKKKYVQMVVEKSNTQPMRIAYCEDILGRAVIDLRRFSTEFGFEADCSAFMAEMSIQLTPCLKQVIDRECMQNHI